MHANSRSLHAGFTLLEVMAALVIISLGLLAVIEAVGQTATNAARMHDRTIAHWVAMNKLTATRLEARSPKVDKTSDEVEMAGRRWRWTMEVTETPVQSMRRIDVRVAEAEADEEASLVTVSGFYGSAIAATRSGPSIWQAPTPASGTPGGEEQPPPNTETDADTNGDDATADPQPPAEEDVPQPPTEGEVIQE
jgi:general secretion pathway protein I